MKLGFIGTGNMASAIMVGIIKNQIIPANDIIGADVMEAGRERVKEQFKIQVTADNHEVINSSDIVILSVKPQFYAEVIAESNMMFVKIRSLSQSHQAKLWRG